MSTSQPGLAARRERLLSPGTTEPVVGLMLRHGWCDELVEREAELDIDFIEVYPENYMRRGVRHLRMLRALADRWPLTAHGVHLSLAGTDPLSEDYLSQVRAFLERFDIHWFGDHLGATVHQGEILHEILPVPLNADTCAWTADRMRATKQLLAHPFMVENTCGYFVPEGTTMSEVDFMCSLLEQADGEMLLDVNNLHVNAQNHGFSSEEYLAKLPYERVREIHIGGFTVNRELGLMVDSHAAAPTNPVWRLLGEAIRRGGNRPILVEWESHFENLDSVLAQLERARKIARAALSERGAA